jgi:hypothetical protein
MSLMPSRFERIWRVAGVGAYSKCSPPTTSMKSLSIELQLLVIAHLPPRDIVHLQQVSYPLHALLGQQ